MGLAVELTIEDAVARIELRGPGKGNAMGPDLWEELPEVMGEVADDDAVRAVVLHGAGKHFTFGLDLLAMMPTLAPHLGGGGGAGQRRELLTLIEQLQGAVQSVADCPKPVIAALWGWCIGGGVDLICATDTRVAAEDARFSVRETRLAMVADLGTLQRLPRVVGPGQARQLAFTGDDIDAQRALRIGLVDDLLPDRQATLDHALAMAARIAAQSPLAVQGAKRVMDWSADRPVRDGLDYVAAWNAAFLASDDLVEALTAFREGRAPVFEGR
jgi:enoyl-CoA hydratase